MISPKIVTSCRRVSLILAPWRDCLPLELWQGFACVCARACLVKIGSRDGPFDCWQEKKVISTCLLPGPEKKGIRSRFRTLCGPEKKKIFRCMSRETWYVHLQVLLLTVLLRVLLLVSGQGWCLCTCRRTCWPGMRSTSTCSRQATQLSTSTLDTRVGACFSCMLVLAFLACSSLCWMIRLLPRWASAVKWKTNRGCVRISSRPSCSISFLCHHAQYPKNLFMRVLAPNLKSWDTTLYSNSQNKKLWDCGLESCTLEPRT